MTQEELDSLMAGDLDDVATLDEEIDAPNSDHESEEEGTLTLDVDNFRIDANVKWPPPPPTEDHKVVNQLDDVTKDSEKKATEIFDKLEEVNTYVMDIEEENNQALPLVENSIAIFEKLHQKFPQIETFSTSLKELQQAKTHILNGVEKSQQGQDDIIMIMDIMQYQDIHRQKIERVINVMRALSKYMNSLFDSKIDDSERVSSAVHIKGDKDTEDLVDNNEIEALLAQFNK